MQLVAVQHRLAVLPHRHNASEPAHGAINPVQHKQVAHMLQPHLVALRKRMPAHSTGAVMRAAGALDQREAGVQVVLRDGLGSEEAQLAGDAGGGRPMRVAGRVSVL